MYDSEEVAHQENLIEDITRLACDEGLEYVTKLLEAHQRLSNEDLYKELSREQSEKEKYLEETPGVMKTTDLNRIVSPIKSLADELCDLDNDWEPSANIKMSIIAYIRPYLKENKNLNN